jgi:hypothetical protein
METHKINAFLRGGGWAFIKHIKPQGFVKIDGFGVVLQDFQMDVFHPLFPFLLDDEFQQLLHIPPFSVIGGCGHIVEGVAIITAGTMEMPPFFEGNNCDRFVVFEEKVLFHPKHTHQKILGVRRAEGLLDEF